MRAAADVMRVADDPGLAAKPGVRHARGWLLPLAAAASVVVIALAAVFLGHLAASAATRGGSLLKAEHASPDATVLRNLALVRNSVGGLSWAPGGHMLIVGEYWTFFGQSPVRPDLAVVGLDTASSGGSLQAHSRLLFLQGQNCVTCVQEAIAGPGDSLTAVALRAAGTQRTRLLVVRIPPTGGPRTVLYTALSPTPMADDWTAIFADPSGQWVIAWPLYDADKTGWESIQAGWISGGTLHPLPGTTLLFENGLAW